MAIAPLESAPADRWDLVMAHRERLLGIAHARCDNPADAEDCVQEAMLRVATFADLDESRVGQLLTSIVIRLAVDTFRVRARTARVAHKIVTPSTIGGVDGPVCDKAEAEWLAQHAQQLPAIQRDVITARASGASWDAIARNLGTSFKTVESAASRARASLRAKWWAAAILVGGFVRRVRSVLPTDNASMTAAAAVVALGVGGFSAGHVADVGSHHPAPAALWAPASAGADSAAHDRLRLISVATRPMSPSQLAGSAHTVAKVAVGNNSVGVDQQPQADPNPVRRALHCQYAIAVHTPSGAGDLPTFDTGCKE